MGPGHQHHSAGRARAVPRASAVDDRWRRNQARRATPEPRPTIRPSPSGSELVSAVTDRIGLRRHEWTWALVPYTTFVFVVEPRDAPAFDCRVRFSDLAELERHHTIASARRDGEPRLPLVPPRHTVPLVGKLLDSRQVTDVRALDIQLYLHALLGTGGGVRDVALDFLRGHRM